MQAELQSIEAMESTADLGKTIGLLISQTDSSSFFFGLGSQQDAKQSETMIGVVHAGRTGPAGP